MSITAIVVAAACGANDARSTRISRTPEARLVTTITSVPPELVAAREAVWRAYYRGDSARLIELLPDTMIAMSESRAQIIAGAQRAARDERKLTDIEFSRDEFAVTGDMAVSYATYTLQFDNNGKRSTEKGEAIELFIKRNGKWINPSWHLHRPAE